MTDDPKGLVAGSDNSRTTNWQAAETQEIEIRPVAVEQMDRLLAASPDDYWKPIVAEVENAGSQVRHAYLLNHQAAHLLAWATIARSAAAHRIEAAAAKDAEIEEAFMRLCEALGIPATAGAYLEANRILTRATKAEAELETCREALGKLASAADACDPHCEDYPGQVQEAVNEAFATLRTAPTTGAAG